MLALEQYAKIKNYYCLGYFGNCDEYLVQLRLIKPILEKKFNGLNIYLSCKDNHVQYLEGCDNIIPISELRQNKFKFAHMKEIRYNGQIHPIISLLQECNINRYAIPINPPKDHTGLCIIISKGMYPTCNLTQSQIQILSKIGREKGYEVQVDGNWQSAGMALGVESVELFEMASRGLSTTLVPTGIGTRLYENMFPDGQILKL